MSIDFSEIKSVTIPEGRVKKILQGAVVLWKSGFKNWVLFSIDENGNIYNGGLGYKSGYRVRSGGAEGASDDRHVCTGFIPCKAGDVIRAYSKGKNAFEANALSAMNFYDSSKTNLGQVVSNSSGYGIFSGSYEWRDKVTAESGLMTYTVSTSIAGTEDIAFCRVTAGGDDYTTKEGFIVTINEEFEVPA